MNFKILDSGLAVPAPPIPSPKTAQYKNHPTPEMLRNAVDVAFENAASEAAGEEPGRAWPKYDWPIGPQPDGSFVLSPKLVSAMKQMRLSLCRNGITKPNPAAVVDAFFTAIYDECGWDMEVPT